jgi:aspartyl-tRNA synthetase
MATQPLRDSKAGLLRAADIGRTVRLAGWIARRRDHGGVIFIDVRDASGIVQVVLNPEHGPADEDVLHGLRSEFCIAVEGTVVARPDGTSNADLPTGEIDVVASSLTVLSAADPLPFQITDRVEVDEAKRLEYRYLDLRRSKMAANLRARSRTVQAMRRVLEDSDFLEVETPTLIASTPEGARDMLVPSRMRRGHFYALPQSPQLFKQMLMVAGVERYYQIARCYRDEDLRADRQLEFTQLDLEGSFWGQDDVLATLEEIVFDVVNDVRGVELPRPFPRMTYADAMRRYGTDKPDTRFGMEITDLSTVFEGTDFKAFAGVLASGGTIRAINAGPLGLARSGLDAQVDRALALGAKGLVWMVVQEDGSLRSPVAKFLSTDEMSEIKASLVATTGDVLLIVADSPKVVTKVLGSLRLDHGQPDGHQELEFLFVIDFPVFDETDEGTLVAAHHPFTSPHSVSDMRDHPRSALSNAYDMVVNGIELGSGSVRIHDPVVQQQVFEVLGISQEEADARFGWFVRALRFGTPPHAGFAIGIDRFVSVLQNEPNIREVIPFPKTQTGGDPLTGAPLIVEGAQLDELGLVVAPDVLAAWESTDVVAD